MNIEKWLHKKRNLIIKIALSLTIFCFYDCLLDRGHFTNYQEGYFMENQDQNIKTENEQFIPKTKPKKRKKKTVSDIELQIKELQKKKEELILKSKADSGDFVLSTLSKNNISIESIEENKELFYDELETLLNANSQNFSELLK